MEKFNRSSIRIVFLGTPDFAVQSLEKLVDEGFNVVGVVTAPDKPAGRGYKMQSPAVKLCADEHNIPVLQPTNLKDENFLQALKDFQADLQIVVAFRMLPEVVWAMPSLGTFNLHASLLPQYRGAAPINWAIINGESKSGVTTFFLKHEIDTGAIIDQKEVDISETMTAGDLHDILMVVGADLVIDTVDKIINNDVQPIEQNTIVTNELKSAPKLNRDMAQINWDQDVNTVHNFVRGLSPFPGAWTRIKLQDENQQKQFKILTASYEKADARPGSLSLSKNAMKIGCQNGYLIPQTVQLEGKKRMTIQELLNGISFDVEQKLS